MKKNYKKFIKSNNNNNNNKSILKTQQIFRSEKHNVFAKEIYKIALNSNDDKRMQSIDLIEIYAHGMNLVCNKEEIK